VPLNKLDSLLGLVSLM